MYCFFSEVVEIEMDIIVAIKAKIISQENPCSGSTKRQLAVDLWSCEKG